MLNLNIDYNNQTYEISDEARNQIVNGVILTSFPDISVHTSGTIEGTDQLNLDGDFPVTEIMSNAMPNFIMHKPQEYRKMIFDIVGAGGTGGYVVRDLARFLYSLKAKGDTREFIINLYDGDRVEEKNLIRQNFIPKDIGKFKSQVLANRYTAAFGIEINAVTEFANSQNLSEVGGRHPHRDCRVVIGCVDNNEARRSIQQVLVRHNRSDYWIDSGNERKSGQVMCGFRSGIISNYSYALGATDISIGHNENFPLPFVTDVYPEIMDPTQDHVGDDGTSCADRAVEEEQNIFVNMTAAVHVLNFARQIIRQESMSIFGLEFNIKGVNNVYHINREKYFSILENNRLANSR